MRSWVNLLLPFLLSHLPSLPSLSSPLSKSYFFPSFSFLLPSLPNLSSLISPLRRLPLPPSASSCSPSCPLYLRPCPPMDHHGSRSIAPMYSQQHHHSQHNLPSQPMHAPVAPFYPSQHRPSIDVDALAAGVQRYLPGRPPSGYVHSNSYIHLPPGVDPATVDFRTFYPYNPSEVKHRKRTTRSQLKVLEETFKRETKPNAALRKQLAAQLEMTPRGVQVRSLSIFYASIPSLFRPFPAPLPSPLSIMRTVPFPSLSPCHLDPPACSCRDFPSLLSSRLLCPLFFRRPMCSYSCFFFLV